MIAFETDRGHNLYSFHCPFCGGKTILRVPVEFTEAGTIRCPFQLRDFLSIGGELLPVQQPCDGKFIQTPRKYGRPPRLSPATKSEPVTEQQAAP